MAGLGGRVVLVGPGGRVVMVGLGGQVIIVGLGALVIMVNQMMSFCCKADGRLIFSNCFDRF